MLSESLEQLEESLEKEIRMRECQHALRVHIEAQTPSKMLNIHAWVRFGLLMHQQLLAERHSMQKILLKQLDLSIVSGGSCISRIVKIFQNDQGHNSTQGHNVAQGYPRKSHLRTGIGWRQRPYIGQNLHVRAELKQTCRPRSLKE